MTYMVAIFVCSFVSAEQINVHFHRMRISNLHSSSLIVILLNRYEGETPHTFLKSMIFCYTHRQMSNPFVTRKGSFRRYRYPQPNIRQNSGNSIEQRIIEARGVEDSRRMQPTKTTKQDSQGSQRLKQQTQSRLGFTYMLWFLARVFVGVLTIGSRLSLILLYAYRINFFLLGCLKTALILGYMASLFASCDTKLH